MNDDSLPYRHRELYIRYQSELIDVGFTPEQAKVMLKIWWELLGWT